MKIKKETTVTFSGGFKITKLYNFLGNLDKNLKSFNYIQHMIGDNDNSILKMEKAFGEY